MARWWPCRCQARQRARWRFTGRVEAVWSSWADALINLPSHPFVVLPDKYCDDPKRLRRSLAVLLERPFTTLAFAHGQPLTVNPRARLAALLGEKLPV